jgi:hypothetical protein
MLGIESRALSMLAECHNSWIMPPGLLFAFCFWGRVSLTSSGLALTSWFSRVHLPSSCNYRHAAPKSSFLIGFKRILLPETREYRFFSSTHKTFVETDKKKSYNKFKNNWIHTRCVIKSLDNELKIDNRLRKDKIQKKKSLIMER